MPKVGVLVSLILDYLSSKLTKDQNNVVYDIYKTMVTHKSVEGTGHPRANIMWSALQ